MRDLYLHEMMSGYAIYKIECLCRMFGWQFDDSESYCTREVFNG